MCRVPGGVSGTGPGTASGTGPGTGYCTTLGPPLPCPSLKDTPYMHSPYPVFLACLGTYMAPCTPGTPRRRRTRQMQKHHGRTAPRTLPEASWGSLLSAPMDRPAGLVTWPGNTRLADPLIGTHQPAPRVTRHWAITASSVICTLLWSTFCVAG